MASSHQGTARGPAPLPHAASSDIVLMAPPTASSPPPADDQGTAEAAPLPHLNIMDLRAIAADIKDTLSAAIADLRIDIRSLTDRVAVTEKSLEDHNQVLIRSTSKIDDHTLQLRDVNRHLEEVFPGGLPSRY